MAQRFLTPHNGPRGPRQTRASAGALFRTGVMAGLAVLPVLAAAGCAPGGERFSAAEPAGFWAGLWHGLILAFTFLISLFTDSVQVYEVANTGALYNLGFVLGVCIFFGGGGKAKKFRSKGRREKEREWKDISGKVEEKIRRGIKSWLEESGQEEDREWKELGEKIEEKIKRELRKWADKE